MEMGFSKIRPIKDISNGIKDYQFKSLTKKELN